MDYPRTKWPQSPRIVVQCALIRIKWPSSPRIVCPAGWTLGGGAGRRVGARLGGGGGGLGQRGDARRHRAALGRAVLRPARGESWPTAATPRDPHAWRTAATPAAAPSTALQEGHGLQLQSSLWRLPTAAVSYNALPGGPTGGGGAGLHRPTVGRRGGGGAGRAGCG